MYRFTYMWTCAYMCRFCVSLAEFSILACKRSSFHPHRSWCFLCSVQVESCFTAMLYWSGRIVPFSAATVGDCARILRHALGKCLCGSTPLIAWARAWRPSTEVKCVNGIWCVGSGKHLKLPSIHIHQAHAKQIKEWSRQSLQHEDHLLCHAQRCVHERCPRELRCLATGRVRNSDGERETALTALAVVMTCCVVHVQLFSTPVAQFFLHNLTHIIYYYVLHCFTITIIVVYVLYIEMQTALFNVLVTANHFVAFIYLHWSVPRKSGSLHVMR
jgi:hypothetical protein